MTRVAIVAHLREGAHPEAARLIEAGAPFDLAELGFASHSIYLSATEVAFVFEGTEVEWIVDRLVDNAAGEPFNRELSAAFDAWRKVVQGRPRIAREVFHWEGQQTT